MSSFEWTYELRFIVAVALGFLIGLERESSGSGHKGKVSAGVRTHTLISMFGFGCAWLYHIKAEIVLPVGLLSIAALALIGYLSKLKEGRVGWTSEVAELLTFVIGALSLLTDVWVPMALGIIGTLLLSEKSEIEKYVEKLDKSEFLAVVKFLLITLIVLPALPDKEYTQFNLNPTHIWQIVIMVSTIGFVGYFLMKKLGGRAGLSVSGLLGGVVSSTAVSIAVGNIAKRQPGQSRNALQSSMYASSIMYIRILIIIWIINPAVIYGLWWKLVALGVIGALLSVSIGAKSSAGGEQVSTLQNPFELKPAVMFAVLFVVLSVITVLVKKFFGSGGILTLSAVVGVTDIDPFILSLVRGQQPVNALIVSAIIISMMSNTVIKGIYFGTLAKEAKKETFFRYGLWALLHIPFILL